MYQQNLKDLKDIKDPKGPEKKDLKDLKDHPLSPLHEPLHWRAKRDPKAKMPSLQSFLRKGVSFG